MSSGTRYLKHVETIEDSVPDSFLSFLARDIETHPEHLEAIDASYIQRMQSLVEGIEEDLDALLPEEE